MNIQEVQYQLNRALLLLVVQNDALGERSGKTLAACEDVFEKILALNESAMQQLRKVQDWLADLERQNTESPYNQWDGLEEEVVHLEDDNNKRQVTG